uniref:Variant surface glycoprotein n=1 Tax=Trypanosoma brucei TaxID=5691 RepID=A0A1V0FXS2_9TRYP|nr:variant surface glycoprotein [Trypanosoma brucei]
MTYKSLVAATFMAISAAEAENVHAGQNSGAFAAMCKLARALMEPPEIPPKQQLKTPEYYEILQRNMTLSDSKWQALFANLAKPMEWATEAPQTGAATEDWSEMWEDWKKSIQEIQDTPGKTKNKIKYFSGLTPAQRKAVEPEIRIIAETAMHIVKTPLAAEPTGTLIDSPNIKAKLKALFIGTGATTIGSATLAQIFGTATPGSSNRGTACTATDPADATKTLLAAIACVCDNENSGQAKDICYKSRGGTEWQNTGNPTDTTVRALGKKCLTDDHTSVISTDLMAAIESILDQTTTDGTHTYLGAYETSCNGQQSNGRCIKWENKKPHEILQEAKTPWLSKLYQLSQAISIRKQNNEKILRAQETIKTLSLRAKALENPQHISEVLVPLETSTPGKEGSQQNNQCTNHKANATCTPDNNCKWTSTDKSDGDFCKPKEGEGQTTQAGAKEEATGTAATTGCAKHGTKANCENYKTCDKQNCAWRKGKDNEDDKDTEKCRNGSFLLNKKMALSMAAVFINLVAFQGFKDFCTF